MIEIVLCSDILRFGNFFVVSFEVEYIDVFVLLIMIFCILRLLCLIKFVVKVLVLCDVVLLLIVIRFMLNFFISRVIDCMV